MKVAISKEYLNLKLNLLGIKDEDLSYFAGLFDGEGSLDFRIREEGGHKGAAMSMTVANTNKSVLEWCQQKFGGDISIPKNSNKYICYRWQLQKRKEVLWVISSIYPFLKIKKKEADIFLEGAMALKKQLGSGKGNIKLKQPESYWSKLEGIAKKLKIARHEYKQTSCVNIPSC